MASSYHTDNLSVVWALCQSPVFPQSSGWSQATLEVLRDCTSERMSTMLGPRGVGVGEASGSPPRSSRCHIGQLGQQGPPWISVFSPVKWGECFLTMAWG